MNWQQILEIEIGDDVGKHTQREREREGERVVGVSYLRTRFYAFGAHIMAMDGTSTSRVVNFSIRLCTMYVFVCLYVHLALFTK